VCSPEVPWVSVVAVCSRQGGCWAGMAGMASSVVAS